MAAAAGLSPCPARIEDVPTPPPLDIRRPFDLAPLRHALSQIDGAAVLDADGILRELGVRLVPSPAAESSVASTWYPPVVPRSRIAATPAGMESCRNPAVRVAGCACRSLNNAVRQRRYPNG